MTYYFFFRHADGWISNFTKRGCGHTFIGVQDEKSSHITIVDGLYHCLDVRSIKEIKDFPRIYNGYQVRILKVEVSKLSMYPKGYRNFNALLMFNRCVVMALYLTGLRFKVFTPWQLYKKLRKIESSPIKGLKHSIISIKEV